MSSLEDAERTVDAMEEARVAKAELAHHLAVQYAQFLRDTFGFEVARHAWDAARPKGKIGYRKSDAERRKDALIAALDQTQREMGMTAEQSAERIARDFGLATDPHDVRRSIDRRQEKAK